MDGEEHQINDEINNHDHEQKLKEKKVLFHFAYNTDDLSSFCGSI